MKSEQIMEKLTARNIISIATSLTLVYAVIFSLNNTATVLTALENPMITFILGTFNTVVIIQLW